MTKRQDLCLQRRSRPEQSDQRQANQPANISHQPRASPDSTSLASRIEFPTMTTTDISLSVFHSRSALNFLVFTQPGSYATAQARSSLLVLVSDVSRTHPPSIQHGGV